ncbi:hypothetical protein BZA77DRAFT_297075 [Pyronema omphalodes]|nr:hypothetical protein BZA77DRAFT_297075 [Pyronema omphalodes]
MPPCSLCKNYLAQVRDCIGETRFWYYMAAVRLFQRNVINEDTLKDFLLYHVGFSEELIIVVSHFVGVRQYPKSNYAMTNISSSQCILPATTLNNSSTINFAAQLHITDISVMSNIPTLHLPPALLSCSPSSIYLRLIKEHIGDNNEYYVCLHTLYMYSRCRFEQSKTSNNLRDILADNTLFNQLKHLLSLPSENQFIGSETSSALKSDQDIYLTIKNRISDGERYKEYAMRPMSLHRVLCADP